ncbi:3-oxoacyl-[acyl-carrier-protein] synthase, KASII [Chitinispirillum alkaliphilum]|nr:3-oxoacyl-[acyl-carrier-protein] synthase, KASII [Chitinispirillum alkaliphilum]
MNSDKVYISKTGIMCSLGINSAAVSENLATKAPLTEVKDYKFHQFDSPLSVYKVQDFDPVEILGKKGLRNKDYATKLLLSTMESSIKDIMDEEKEHNRPGLCIGTAFGSVQSIGDFLSDSIENGVNNVNPQEFANTVINAPTGQGNIRYGVRNLSTTISTGFNSGLDSLIYSKDFISCQYLDRLIAGGLEEISYYELLGFIRSGIISKTSSAKPFGANADGVIPGEGCAVFLLENEKEALSDGKKPLVQIIGTASGFDPDIYSNSSDNSVGADVILKALSDAKITADQLDFIASSGSGNPLSDRFESAAISSVFKKETPVTAYKHSLGECYGASGSLITACAIYDMKKGTISGIDEEYETVNEINLVRGTVKKNSRYVLVTSFSCEGNCSAIVLENI